MVLACKYYYHDCLMVVFYVPHSFCLCWLNFYYKRAVPSPILFIIQLFIYIRCMDFTWFYGFEFNAIMLWLTLVPVLAKSSYKADSVSFWHAVIICSTLPNIWHQKRLQIHLVFSPPQPWCQPGTLFPLSENDI